MLTSQVGFLDKYILYILVIYIYLYIYVIFQACLYLLSALVLDFQLVGCVFPFSW